MGSVPMRIYHESRRHLGGYALVSFLVCQLG